MLYNCENCHKSFDFVDKICFCPYCGSRLAPDAGFAASGGHATQAASDEPKLTEVIDSIWGRTAKLRNVISAEVLQCVRIFNRYAKYHIERNIPTIIFPNYNIRYMQFEKCGNRKDLLDNIRRYIMSLEQVIAKASEDMADEVVVKLQKAVREVYDVSRRLHDLIGKDAAPSESGFFDEERFSVTRLFTKEQLAALYEQVLIAFEKYRRCVEDNNMFAAFASDSSYGALPYYWRRIYAYSYDRSDRANDSRKKTEDEDDRHTITEKAQKEYTKIMEYMDERNAIAYDGFLDEDFEPHVEAFWKGLSTLCGFIDNATVIRWDKGYFVINENESAAISRYCQSEEFPVSEDYLTALVDMESWLEEKEKEDR